MIAVDSNLLIYSLLRSDDVRHGRALLVLDRLVERRQFFLPLQVIGETFHVLVRKARFDASEASRMIGTYASFAHVEPYHHDDVLAGMEAVAQHRLSFWDAVIWAVCERSGVATLLTEDMQDGRTLGRVTFVDPFGKRAAALLQV